MSAEGGEQRASPGHEAIDLRRRQAGLSLEQLWISYFELTGDATQLELDAYLNGLMPLPPMQVEILLHALNEALTS